MGAVWLGLRAELRTRWRALVVLALLVGIGAGIVMATLAGARRTDSAYDRFLVSQHADDVLIPSGGSVFGFADLDVDDIAALPEVVEHASFEYYQLGIPLTAEPGDLDASEAAFFADRDDKMGTTIDRLKILEGRRPRPDRPFELAVGFLLAEQYDLEVGDRLELAFVPADADYLAGDTQARLFDFEIVGIEAAPQEFPPLSDATVPFIHAAPAFDARFRGELLSIPAIAVRLRDGRADVPAFKAGVERLADGEPVLLFDQHEHADGVQRSIHVQVQALTLLGTLVAAIALLVVGQAIARQVLLESQHSASLRVLGMTRAQLMVSAGLRMGIAAGAGAVLAVLLAFALSPLAPAGLAGRAETDPGLAFDWYVLGLGAAVTVVFALGTAVLTTWWSNRRNPVRTVTEPAGGRPSRVAAALARASFPLPAVAGSRMALSAGAGRTAVPLRTTLFGAMVAIATGVGALGFTASLDHLLDKPALYGVGWDAEFGGEFGSAIGDDELGALVDDKAIAGLAVGTSAEIELDDRERVPALALDTEKPPLTPTVIEGRVPQLPTEILLGTKTLDALDAAVGERVTVAVGGRERPMRIVGRGVLPVVGDGGLGRGAFLTFDGMRSLTPGVDRNYAVVRFAPGVDRDAVVQRLAPAFSGSDAAATQALPVDLVNFGRVDNMPRVIAALMALLAVAALAHALFTAVRRRRRDLAVLKTLGFGRRQLAATVAWQASVLALLAVVVGIPLGIAAGRWAWKIFADSLGVVYEPVVPVALVAAVVPAALVLANLVAAVPGWMAARTQAATVLRAE